MNLRGESFFPLGQYSPRSSFLFLRTRFDTGKIFGNFFPFLQIIVAQDGDDFHDGRTAAVQARNLPVSPERGPDEVMDHPKTAVLILGADPRLPHNIFIE